MESSSRIIKTMALEKIISGGQTGADQAGLAAAVELGLQTGGMMPKGFRADDGPRPRFQRLYGMQEHPRSDKYPPRTEWNVRNSDGTLIFGDANSPGSRLTSKLCLQHDKLLIMVHHLGPYRDRIGDFTRWLEHGQIKVLNVAGNRESAQPGIYQKCYGFLIEALS